MKKYIFFALMLLVIGLCLFNTACSNDIKQKEYKNLDIVHKWIKKNVNRKVVNKVDLPTACPDVNGAVISWSSTEPKVIDNMGRVISRPSDTKRVMFNYTIKIGDNVNEKYEMGIYVSSKTLEEVENEFLKMIPSTLKENISFPNVFAGGAVEVIIATSDENILSSSGKYTQPNIDSKIEINYIVTDGNEEITGNVSTFAKAKSEKERLNNTIKWLNEIGFNELLLDSKTIFPKTCETENTLIYWSSSNVNVCNKGQVIQNVYERHVTMKATIIAGNEFVEVEYYCTVKALDTSSMSEEEIIERFISAIAVKEYEQLSFNQDPNGSHNSLEPYGYTNITNSYGFINFIGTVEYSMNENFIPLGRDNRPGTKFVGGLQYITIHDTAGISSSSNAKNVSNWCVNPTNKTSWHFTVDSQSVYQQLPIDEIAYHAGDGRTRYFVLIDSGIEASSKIPVVSLKDGYYYINGIKTDITPFKLDDKNPLMDYSIPTQANINKLGVLCEIGDNGNYFLGKTYLNSEYDLIGNYGGNTNSIGIETCVNAGSDYATTIRVLVNLVAKLMIENNLDIDRVKGHHYFSGKPCPNAIMLAGWWSEFLDLLAMEKYAMENFSDLDFIWNSSSDILFSNGSINKDAVDGEKIEYSVRVMKDLECIFENSYVTILE